MMTVPASWRKSSYSAEQTDCVEVAGSLAAVRDTKNPAVMVRGDVRALVRAIRSGRIG